MNMKKDEAFAKIVVPETLWREIKATAIKKGVDVRKLIESILRGKEKPIVFLRSKNDRIIARRVWLPRDLWVNIKIEALKRNRGVQTFVAELIGRDTSGDD